MELSQMNLDPNLLDQTDNLNFRKSLKPKQSRPIPLPKRRRKSSLKSNGKKSTKIKRKNSFKPTPKIKRKRSVNTSEKPSSRNSSSRSSINSTKRKKPKILDFQNKMEQKRQERAEKRRKIEEIHRKKKQDQAKKIEERVKFPFIKFPLESKIIGRR